MQYETREEKWRIEKEFFCRVETECYPLGESAELCMAHIFQAFRPTKAQ